LYSVFHQAKSSSASSVRWLPTFNMLVRRAAFDSAGGFNEYLATCEDCELGYRLSRAGSLVIDPQTQAAHLGEAESLGDLFRREAWRSRGNLQLAWQHPLDVSNWLSLLAPPCLVVGFIVALSAIVLSLLFDLPRWPFVGTLAATVGLTVVLMLRKSRPSGVVSFAQQWAVFVVYLAARSAGLVGVSRPVTRKANASGSQN
jgi:hypothetical protein